MTVQEVEIFIRSTETGQVTEKRKTVYDIAIGESLEIWVNDRLEYEHKPEEPWIVEPSADKEYRTKW